MIKMSIIILLLLNLVGCYDKPDMESNFEAYHQRIANAQNSDALEYQAVVTPTAPVRRTIAIELPRISMGLLDSYELHQCGLFNLIAEKNSSLGKVQDPFREYHYQTQFLTLLEQCLKSDLSPDIREALLLVKGLKIGQLSVYYYQLLYGSDALRTQLFPNGHKFNLWLDPTQSLQQHANALNTLDKLAPQNRLSFTFAQQKHLLDIQELLEKDPAIGQLNYTLIATTHWLKLTNQQLRNNDRVITCGKNRNTQKLTILNNVFQIYFIEKIHPYLSHLDRNYKMIEPYIAVFSPIKLSETLNKGQQVYYYPIAKHYREYREAMKQHINYWQQLFQRCDVSFGLRQ
ncbi:DUF3080 domain-containing protein [Vibrio sp. SS-MA-C1-2]|uniref:DUF3080 family protein n=1 Tax=Vibrio sp. SS-MA-C1-2 TaxID=2908646 RepID=UPI001F1FEC01|nr:DUF3080 family protein [Vibrio sp. SS-MA-C1-2]UJF17537.1 DUF3080 domain-containing protein [Vibrio sp. SS-MA-C1-2]